ncbi:hypothetical protein DFJ43DRAFT_1104765, partial [Lentinula guzmanii]
MHLISSPAHLFTVVLLSIVLGVMTMAVPLTVRNTNSKRDVGLVGYTVGLVRRYGPEVQSSTIPAIVRTQTFQSPEYWHLYITQRRSFHAVQKDQGWQFIQVTHERKVHPKLILGSIEMTEDIGAKKVAQERMDDLYLKIRTNKITARTQFEAFNALMNYLMNEIPYGLEYKPNPEDPDAWTKIYLAMTNYDQYLRKFPDLTEKDRYIKLSDGTAEAQRAAEAFKRKFGLTTAQPETAQP